MTLTNVRAQIKEAGSLSQPFSIKSDLRQADALSCILFNQALEEMRGTILLQSTQLLIYAYDVHIMRRTTQEVQSAFILTEPDS